MLLRTRVRLARALRATLGGGERAAQVGGLLGLFGQLCLERGRRRPQRRRGRRQLTLERFGARRLSPEIGEEG
eukprot:1730918-Prymnesium_polylepis.1